MQGKITIIDIDGTETVNEYDRKLELSDLKSAIGGGLIQIIPALDTFRGERCVALCDDEGKLKNFKINFVATGYWLVAFNSHFKVPQPLNDILVGKVAFITGDDDIFTTL